MYFSENIRFLRQKYQLSQQEAAEHLNIPRTTLGDYERGHTEPNIETLLKIADLYQLSVELLMRFDLTETGADYSDKKGLRILSTTVDSRGRSNIELVRTRAQAGYLESFEDPEFIRELPKIQLPGFKSGMWCRAFEISGDSMAPLQSGSLVICSYVEKLKEIKSGATYVLVSRQNGLVYKRVYPDHKTKTLLLKSDNPMYPSVRIDMEDLTEIWHYEAHLAFGDLLEVFQSWNQYQQQLVLDKLDELNLNIKHLMTKNH
ncbi:MAG: helix-turn-helix domain-containing protein [Saprospiraceae bacterium]|nr:helix-turn-helix domain-containing protein [Saprospiraceae bacterium]